MNDDLDALIDAGRPGDEPSEADRARVRRRLAKRMSAGAIVAGVASSTAATSASAATAGTAVGLGVVGKVFVAMALTSAAGLAGFGGAAAHRALTRPARSERLSTSPTLRASRPSAAPAPAARAVIEASTPPLRTVVAAPTSVARLAPRGTASVVASAPSGEAFGSAVPGLDDESQRLASARTALSTDPRRSLAMLDEYLFLYPHGQLRHDVEAARAIALCAVGRYAEGRATLGALEATALRVVVLERARAACVEPALR